MTAIVVLVKGHNIWLGLTPTSDIFPLSPIMIISRLGSMAVRLGLVKFPPVFVQFPDKYLRHSFSFFVFITTLYSKPMPRGLAKPSTCYRHFDTINITIQSHKMRFYGYLGKSYSRRPASLNTR